MYAKKRRSLSSTWALVRPYWKSEEKWYSLLILAVVVLLTVGQVQLDVIYNRWNAAFYNSLQDRNLTEFLHQLRRWGAILFASVSMYIYKDYLLQLVQLRWRRWLTDHYMGRWLDKSTAYGLELNGSSIDNPDQRIAEDIRDFTAQTIGIPLGLLGASVRIFAFVSVLWQLSGTIALLGIHIAGYMVWIAIAYASVGSVITHFVGRKLISLNFVHQQREADLRFSLVRIREFASEIALSSGQEYERVRLSSKLRLVAEVILRTMRRTRRLNWATMTYSSCAAVFPYVVTAPRYFSGALKLGGVVQTAGAFANVQSSLSWFVGAYSSLASWKATTDRLIGFEAGLQHSAATAKTIAKAITNNDSPAHAVHIRNLRTWLPNGITLETSFSLDVLPGRRYLLQGPSGCGKSTLLKSIAGVWPHFSGEISVPDNTRVLFLPQNPYLPISALSSATIYPSFSDAVSQVAISETLHLCGLTHLLSQISTERNWEQELSPGELQRIQFARALLLKPDWLFMDEPTSALDKPSEYMLFELLLSTLPNAGVVTVSHHPDVKQFHHQTLMLGSTLTLSTDGNLEA